MFKKIALAGLATALLFGAIPAQAAVGLNGISLNGMRQNGLSLNGMRANGLSLNGTRANGLSLNGMRANGLSLNGLRANDLSLNGVARKGTATTGAESAKPGQDTATRFQLVSVKLPPATR